MEITYTKHGNYLLPDLTLKDTKKGNINKQIWKNEISLFKGI